MLNYYRFSPRGFSNEDIIISADLSKEKHKKEIERLETISNTDPNAWLEKITRKEAENRTANNRKRYKTGECNYCNPAGATEIINLDDSEYWY